MTTRIGDPSPVAMDAGPTRPTGTEGARRPSSRWVRSLGMAGLAVVVGLAAGRFATYEAAPAVPPPTIASGGLGALAALERAVAAAPDDPTALRQLGGAYVRRSAETGDPSYYGLAEQAFTRSAVLAPDEPETLVGQGALALARHRFEAALVLGERAPALAPFDADALAVVVDAQVELGRYDAAATTLQELLDLRPDLAALSRLSYLRQLQGDLRGALVAMQQAQSAGSATPGALATVWAYTGDIYLERGDLAAAGAAYDTALRLVPDLVVAEVGAARVAAGAGATDDAVRRLQALLDRLPSPAPAALLADLHALAGREDEATAARDLVRAMSQLQRDAGQVVDLELALFEADHGDPARAVSLARAVHAERPTVFAADALAWALHRSGDDAAAVPLVEEAMRLGTVDASIKAHAAAVFAGVGQTDRARAELEVALRGNAWGSFGRRAEVRRLAGELGLPVPATWEVPV